MLLSNFLSKKPSGVQRISCDVLVLGGGSGGLACAQKAARSGASVVLCDFVQPSETRGSVWGLGGTCVNVGCVPKKLFHRAGLFGSAMADGELHAFGYTPEKHSADWTTVVNTVQNHVKMLNFTYRSSLPDNLTYLNGRAAFHSQEEDVIHVVEEDSVEHMVQVKEAIVIAVGGRPIVPDIPLAREVGITSDDLFSIKSCPNKSLVVGGSYIGLETASFLAGMGYDTSLLVRSQPLRGQGFDRDCGHKLLELMEDIGVNIIHGVNLDRFDRVHEQTLVTFEDGRQESFDTIIFGTGRKPVTEALNLPSRVQTDAQGKIRVDRETFLASGCSPKVYAIGDCAATDTPELTPVAIRQGELVAGLVTNDGSFPNAKALQALNFVPSTVFTLPSEYARVGLSEQDAMELYGQEEVEVFLREWQPLEASAAHLRSAAPSRDEAGFRGFVKLVCRQDRIVGLHLVAPSAGEMIHGLALACSLGATKSDFDFRVLGIHPTDSEALTDVSVTRSSGLEYRVAAGCGGGKCG